MKYWILLCVLVMVGCTQTQKPKPTVTHQITSFYKCLDVVGELIDTDPPVCEAPDGVIWVGPRNLEKESPAG